VRRKWITGVAQRTISSTAVGAMRSKSAIHRARSAGKSVSALMPWLIALRVVSLPATTRRMKNDPSSWLVSRSPSTSAWMRAVVMSSRGRVRRASASACPYWKSSTAAAMSSSRLLAYSGSPTPRMMFVSSKMRRWSISGMPIMSQMMRRGSAAATSSTKSHAPFGATASTIRRACARTDSSTCLMVRGVNPALTSFRSFVCRGASMLIIEPKNSLSSGVWSGMLTPCPETKLSASMLARTTSA